MGKHPLPGGNEVQSPHKSACGQIVFEDAAQRRGLIEPNFPAVGLTHQGHDPDTARLMSTDALRIFAILEVDNSNRLVVTLCWLLKDGKSSIHQHRRQRVFYQPLAE